VDAWLEAHRTPLALALLAIAAVGAAFWLQRAGGERPLVVAVGSPTAPPGGLMVYVSGEVARPGVYPFQEGDRVERAIAAAGGPTADADLTAINLAIKLKDEQQVHVPRRGEGGTAGSGSSVGPSGGPPLVDLNAATRPELEALPGIGPVTAQRIVDYRERNGPFQQVEELKTNKLVTSATFEKIRGLVTVR